MAPSADCYVDAPEWVAQCDVFLMALTICYGRKPFLFKDDTIIMVSLGVSIYCRFK